jgi:hypothetical protein
MFDIMQSKHVRENEDVEGFGLRFDSDTGKNLIKNPIVKVGDVVEGRTFLDNYTSVKGFQTKSITFTPLFGIIQQGKMIPLRYCPLSFEFEVCNHLYDPIITHLAPGWQASIIESNFGSANPSDYSANWQIENPVIKCDVCQMDSELNNQFAQRFLSGQTIPISYSTFVVQTTNTSRTNAER